MIRYEDRVSRGSLTAKEAAARAKRSVRSAQRWTSSPRAEWIQEKADRREAIRAYHDDHGHSWTETATHFKIHTDTAKQLGYKARKERAAEKAALKETEQSPSQETLF